MMIADMLKSENVKIIDSVQDWRDAVKVSLKELVDGGYVEERYIDNVIESTLHYGPYYVITENVALIHGRPEEGVKKKQLAVTLLRKPVRFSEDSYPVRLLIALAATDSNSHVDVMRVLASVFMDESKINEMVSAKTKEQLYQLFIKAENETED